jgi:FG-GAP-like repeat
MARSRPTTKAVEPGHAVRVLLAAAVGACWGAVTAAQPPFYRDVTATHLPADLAGPCMDAAAGDADGDGDLDLVLAMEFRPNLLLMNDGTGVFTDESDRLPQTVHDSEDVAFADFDADGDLDLAFVSEDDRADELYLNDGEGRFTDASNRLATNDVSNALAVLDLNGDGTPDLLIGNVGTDRVLINDGGGRFRDETALRWPQSGASRTQDLELADVDGDGDLDVLVGNEGQNELFLNDDGRLLDATARLLPSRADETREIRAADVDGDGDLDLLVANVRFVLEAPLEDFLLLNDGTGAFTTADTAWFPEGGRDNFTIQAVDLDRDGDLDVVLPVTVTMAQPAGDYRAMLNDGAGHFTLAEAGAILPAEVDGNGFDVEVADFDGDGIPDLFLCNRASNPAPGTAAAVSSGGRQRMLLAEPPAARQTTADNP